MTITKVENMADFNALMEISKTKLVVIDFSATWYVSKYGGGIIQG